MTMQEMFIQWVSSLLESADELTVAGIFIAGVVLVLVAFLRQFYKEDKNGDPVLDEDGEPIRIFRGNRALLMGFFVGMFFAVMAYLVNNEPPAGLGWHTWTAYIFTGILYGVIIGVMPSGTYELVFKNLTSKKDQ